MERGCRPPRKEAADTIGVMIQGKPELRARKTATAKRLRNVFAAMAPRSQAERTTDIQPTDAYDADDERTVVLVPRKQAVERLRVGADWKRLPAESAGTGVVYQN